LITRGLLQSVHVERFVEGKQMGLFVMIAILGAMWLIFTA